MIGDESGTNAREGFTHLVSAQGKRQHRKDTAILRAVYFFTKYVKFRSPPRSFVLLHNALTNTSGCDDATNRRGLRAAHVCLTCVPDCFSRQRHWTTGQASTAHAATQRIAPAMTVLLGFLAQAKSPSDTWHHTVNATRTQGEAFQ